jgi:AcrR family transcriptional regulator
MRNIPRLTAEARKEAIVEAVQDIFAEKGFDGTTIKELAQAAKVSEALLYKHFPSKESLYAAMLDACSRDRRLRKRAAYSSSKRRLPRS